MSTLEDILIQHQNEFYPVVPFMPQQHKLLRMDFTQKNKELTEQIFQETQTFSDYITATLKQLNAIYGIGGYAEHRTIYSRSSVFDPVNDDEPRRLHLGIDIWGKPLTPVRAPLGGFVHSFAFNNANGDYGATIILSHQLDGVSFFTLYGHLSLASIKNLSEGIGVNTGDVIGEFGIPQENGNWPPHLHFQIVKDLQGAKGDYPGVCKYSERAFYLANCPDADLILDMMKLASSPG